jgi:NhaP-type Na+/H+ or K+/H+ antiporter
MGAGLKLNRPPGWRRWIITWRLLAITMPLSIVGIALLGWWGLGLAPAAALLLGAVLAPTDPVLASDVQVGPPHDPRRTRSASA